MSRAAPDEILRRSVESGRLHSAYLLSGPGDAPREAALTFVRALVCGGSAPRPCEDCSACRRSRGNVRPDVEEIVIDGSGRKGPLYRHVGDHPDLLWVERGPDDTRVRIAQIRALQGALRLRSTEGGERAAVVADAEWLNAEAQNALLRLLEEPPPQTRLVLVAASASGLLATVRSRCLRIAFPPRDPGALLGSDASDVAREIARRLEGIGDLGIPALLDWAAEYRGVRASAAENVEQLLEVSSAWIRQQVIAAPGESDPRSALDAFGELSQCRKALAQRNANPQMVAERALLALRDAMAR